MPVVFLFAALIAVSSVSCTGRQDMAASEVPALDEYCRVAQRIVTRTEQPVDLRIQSSFDGFVKSKAIIPEGAGSIPEIQQFNWATDDGAIVGVSCKLKSADHLNMVYGDGTAGFDGECQDMNRYVFEALDIAPGRLAYGAVIFDPREQAQTEGGPPVEGGPGPQWLASYDAVAVDADNKLVIRTKGFRVDFSDPRFARAPARFRGVHYCHFIAPGHLRRLATGAVQPATVIGRSVDLSRYGMPEQ